MFCSKITLRFEVLGPLRGLKWMDMNKNIVADVIWLDFEPYIYCERLCTDGVSSDFMAS